jgi:hypothetical protein
MTTITKLYSLEEVENWIMECDSVGIVPDMAKQLADIMRDNERLKARISNLDRQLTCCRQNVERLKPKRKKIQSCKHRDQLNSVNKEDGNETNTDKS